MRNIVEQDSWCWVSRNQAWYILLSGCILLFLSGCEQEQESEPTNQVVSSSDSSDQGNQKDSTERGRETSSPPENRTLKVETKTVAIAIPDFLDAALQGKLATVRQAIEGGVDVNAEDEQQRTALLLAAFNGHTSVVKFLLEKGALLEQKDVVGRTALMFAATGANAETVDLLISTGAEINLADENEGFTALMHAAAEGQVEVVKILLKHKADSTIRDKDGDTARDFATRNGHFDVIRLLTK